MVRTDKMDFRNKKNTSLVLRRQIVYFGLYGLDLPYMDF